MTLTVHSFSRRHFLGAATGIRGAALLGPLSAEADPGSSPPRRPRRWYHPIPHAGATAIGLPFQPTRLVVGKGFV